MTDKIFDTPEKLEVLRQMRRETRRRNKPRRHAAQAQEARAEFFEKQPNDAGTNDAGTIKDNENILDLFAKDFGKVIAGEETNGKLLYLVATSRLLERTMNAAIKGTSAGGKSEIRKRVLDFFPPESIVSFTSLSEKSLIYYDGDFAHKILSMGEAAATDEQDFQDYLLRELMSEGHIRHSTVQRVGSQIVPIVIEKKGPVSFLVTTTKNKLHAENETRMLSLEIDDSEEQTKRVLEKVAQVEGLNHAAAQVDYEPWRNFQRWLESGARRVVVPFADKMVSMIPAKAVRLRRDVGQVIRAIKAHALLHRAQRLRDDNGHIVADIERDYGPVRDLMHALLAEGSGVSVSRQVAETIAAVRAASSNLPETEGANAQDVARFLKLDKSAAWRRLVTAKMDGYVANLEQRRGMPGKYRVIEQKLESMAILPATSDLLTADAPPTPTKPAQPCNREEQADIVQGLNGCTDGCNPFAVVVQPTTPVVADCITVAERPASVKPVNGQAELPPVAGLQPFSGVWGHDDAARVCAQCGAGPLTDPPSDSPTKRVKNGDAVVWLHTGPCHRVWMRERAADKNKTTSF